MKVDEFIYKIIADNSSYKKGAEEVRRDQKQAREDARKTSEDMGRRGKEGSEFFKAFATSAAKLFLVLKGGQSTVSYIKNLVTNSANLGYAAKNLGTTEQNLKSLANMAEQFGGNAEDAATSFASLVQAFNDYKVGNTDGILKFFNMFNVNPAESKNGVAVLRDQWEIYDELRKKALKMAADAGGGSVAAGRSFVANALANAGQQGGIINMLLEENADKYESMKATALANARPAAEAAAAANDLRQQYLDLKQRFESWALGKIPDLAPRVESLLQALKELGDWASDHQDLLKNLFLGGVAAIAAFKAAVGVGGLLSALGALVSPLGIIAALIGAISLAASGHMGQALAIAKNAPAALMGDEDARTEMLANWQQWNDTSSMADKKAEIDARRNNRELTYEEATEEWRKQLEGYAEYHPGVDDKYTRQLRAWKAQDAGMPGFVVNDRNGKPSTVNRLTPEGAWLKGVSGLLPTDAEIEAFVRKQMTGPTSTLYGIPGITPQDFSNMLNFASPTNQLLPIGAGGSGLNLTIGKIDVNAPRATDAKGVAAGIGSALNTEFGKLNRGQRMQPLTGFDNSVRK